jgi:hypothetical protein
MLEDIIIIGIVMAVVEIVKHLLKKLAQRGPS